MEETAPPGRLRVCVIGSSFVGAVLRAYKKISSDCPFVFQFFSSPQDENYNIRIEDGKIIGAKFATHKNNNIEHYDIFVVYATMSSPHDCINHFGSLNNVPYSRQLKTTIVREAVQRSPAYKTLLSLRNATPNPAFLLSRNVALYGKPISSEDEYSFWVEFLRNVVGSNSYIEFPRALYAKNFIPHADFYKNSINFSGGQMNGEKNPKHDLYHLNEQGGALVLDQIIGHIRQRGDV